MKILRAILGATLLTTSFMGNTTGKAGRYTCVAGEWGAYGSKYVANGAGDLANGAGDFFNTFDPSRTNDFVQINANLSYATGHVAHAAGNALEATERTAKNGQTLFTKVEERSQELNAYANDLLDARKNEYRDLDTGDFD